MRDTADPPPWLHAHADGRALSILGVRLGDELVAVPLEHVGAVEPRTPSKRRSSFSGGGVHRIFDVDEDGSRTEVPRSALLREIAEHGGCLYGDGAGAGVTFVVEARIVRRIVLYGAKVAGAPMTSEGDVVDLVGRPTSISRRGGYTELYYPERCLSITWDARGGRVWSVALGPVEVPRYGSMEVLGAWLDARLTPPFAAPAGYDEAQRVRYARLAALLRAFEVGEPASFARGEFLEGRPLPDSATRDAWLRNRAEAAGCRTASEFFGYLLSRRARCERQYFAGIVLEGRGPPPRRPDSFARHLPRIDALLAELIAPDGRTLDLSELVVRWGYPDVDLELLEGDP